jgi:hypothetical protein
MKRLVAGFPPWQPGFNPGSGQMGFVVHKVALGQVFSKYFGFPCHSFHQILHPHNHLGRYNRPVSGRRAEWTQFGLHPPLCKFKKKINSVGFISEIVLHILCVKLYPIVSYKYTHTHTQTHMHTFTGTYNF